MNDFSITRKAERICLGISSLNSAFIVHCLVMLHRPYRGTNVTCTIRDIVHKSAPNFLKSSVHDRQTPSRALYPESGITMCPGETALLSDRCRQIFPLTPEPFLTSQSSHFFRQTHKSRKSLVSRASYYNPFLLHFFSRAIIAKVYCAWVWIHGEVTFTHGETIICLRPRTQDITERDFFRMPSKIHMICFWQLQRCR